MDGFMLMCKIKIDEWLKKILVVIYFLFFGSVNEDYICKVKVDGYVVKFEINEFFLVIQEMLECVVINSQGLLISCKSV